MIDYESLFDDLAGIGLESWRRELEALMHRKFSDSAHGKLFEWRTVLSQLPSARRQRAELKGPTITAPGPCDVPEKQLKELLMRLAPWRKGPFEICGVHIDAEWRSDMKWDRVKDAISPLTDRAVLDVGCGNGYYAFRMRGMGAKLVIGIDPTLLYVIQFLAICHFINPEPIHVLPLRLHELPVDSAAFDTVLSMGVIYHQRSPEEHLSELRSFLRPGGELH